MTVSARTALAAFALTAALPAYAIGWEWTDEVANREWRDESLTWASDSHPASPSELVLLATTAPPPREMWCTGATAPTVDDCDTFDDLLEDWTHDFLNLPTGHAVPQNVLDAFPTECSSICN